MNIFNYKSKMNLTTVTLEYITKNDDQFRLTDSNKNLKIYSYTKCDKTCDDMHKKSRGIVFNNDNFLVSSNGWTPEFTNDNLEEMRTCFTSDTNPVIFNSEEGCLLRVFYFEDKWYLITHKKLNAFNSRWVSENSWGDMFVDGLKTLNKTLDSFYESLDKDRVYWFIVRYNKDNRMVCQAPEVPTIYHVGTVFNNTLTFDIDIGIPYPQKHNFTTVEEMVEYVEKKGFDSIQGLMVFMKNSSFKLYNTEYHKYLLARGNSSSIIFRYLQVRMDREQRERLCTLYPSFLNTFDKVETKFYEIARNITSGYINRYQYGKYVEFPKSEFESIVRPLHNWHLEDKHSNHVDFNKVIDFLNEQSPKYLNYLRKKREKFTKERPRLLKTLPLTDNVQKKIEI
jgi:hypothetical protein